ncbi:RNase adapter RapZ, partial [Klebsiella pneumoniae]
RFSETRRSHPLSHRLLPGRPTSSDRLTLTECIALEKDMLGDLQDIGLVMDTSQLSSNKLRRWVKDLVDLERSPLTLLIESFG